MRIAWMWMVFLLLAVLCLVTEGILLDELCRDADEAKKTSITQFCTTLQKYMDNGNQGTRTPC